MNYGDKIGRNPIIAKVAAGGVWLYATRDGHNIIRWYREGLTGAFGNLIPVDAFRASDEVPDRRRDGDH